VENAARIPLHHTPDDGGLSELSDSCATLTRPPAQKIGHASWSTILRALFAIYECSDSEADSIRPKCEICGQTGLVLLENPFLKVPVPSDG
jgi:hypothetical protein